MLTLVTLSIREGSGNLASLQAPPIATHRVDADDQLYACDSKNPPGAGYAVIN